MNIDKKQIINIEPNLQNRVDDKILRAATEVMNKDFGSVKSNSPSMQKWITTGWYKHMISRYVWAATYCDNKTVIDACCGCSWGAHILASKAKTVIAYDSEESILKWNKSANWSSKIKYLHHDATQPIYLNADVVVAMECIEHFTEEYGIRFIKNCYDQLNEKGTLIMSSFFSENRVQSDRIFKEQISHKYIWEKNLIKKELFKAGFNDVQIFRDQYLVAKKNETPES